jgi:argininosuccinate synthase
MTNSPMRIVLAHSGGLNTSIAIPWLAEHHDAEVVAVTIHLGQDRELPAIREGALAAGALRAHVIDARGEFVEQYALPALQAGAPSAAGDPQSADLARAIVAARLVDVAHMEAANAIAYGPGLEPWIRALAPPLPTIVPTALWSLSRADKLAYARARSLLVAETEAGGACAANVWGRSVPIGRLSGEDGGYVLTRSASECPDEPAIVDIEFDGGVPVQVNAIDMTLLEMIESLDIIAGAHGVGRSERAVRAGDGTPTRTEFEAPAATVLSAAHAALERLLVPADLDRIKPLLAREYADLVRDGRWASPAREAIDAFVRSIQRRVTGFVRLKLFKGDCHVIAVRSPHDTAAAAAGDRLQPEAEGLTS